MSLTRERAKPASAHTADYPRNAPARCVVRGTIYELRRFTDVTRFDQRIPLELALKRAAKLTIGRTPADLSGDELTELGGAVSTIARIVLVAPDEIRRSLTEVESLSVAETFVRWHAPQTGSIQ